MNQSFLRGSSGDLFSFPFVIIWCDGWVIVEKEMAAFGLVDDRFVTSYPILQQNFSLRTWEYEENLPKMSKLRHSERWLYAK